MAKDVLITPASGKLEVKASNGTTVETKIEDGNIVLTGTLSASGYNDSNWNTGYGWGNHASAGYATESYVGTQIANLIASAPGTLDTLNELAEALNDDPNFATTMTNALATKITASSTDTLTNKSGNISQWTNNSNYITASTTDTLTNKSGAISQWTNDSNYLTSETSHADVVVDGDFASEGLIKRGGSSGSYSIITDNSSNWNTAYTHSQQAHAPSNAEQNVNADWSSSSGDSEILNKPNVQYTSAIPTITSTVGGLLSDANAVKFAGIATGATNVTDNNQIANSAGYITDGNTNWNNSYGFITASSTETLTNKAGNISQWTNDSNYTVCLLYTSPSPRDRTRSRMPSSA